MKCRFLRIAYTLAIGVAACRSKPTVDETGASPSAATSVTSVTSVTSMTSSASSIPLALKGVIPKYPNGTITRTTTGSDGGNATHLVSMETPDDIDRVAVFYKGTLSHGPPGANSEDRTVLALDGEGGSKVIVFDDAIGHTGSVTIARPPPSPKTTVEISVTTKATK